MKLFKTTLKPRGYYTDRKQSFSLEELECIFLRYVRRGDNLQQRIDKAIEYINTHITYDDLEDGSIVKPRDLLEILKGDSDV